MELDQLLLSRLQFAFTIIWHIRPREQDQLARAAAIPMRLDGRDLERLVLGRVEAVAVADEELQRRQNEGKTDGHADHGAAMREKATIEPRLVPRTRSSHASRCKNGCELRVQKGH
jgi:hypothetical protein